MKSVELHHEGPLDEALFLLKLQDPPSDAWYRIQSILEQEIKSQSLFSIKRDEAHISDALRVSKRVAKEDRHDIGLIVGTLYNSQARGGDIAYAVHVRLGLPVHGRSFNAGLETASAIWQNSLNSEEATSSTHVHFNHECHHPGLALGLDTERVNEIRDQVVRVINDPHPDHDCTSQRMEEALGLISKPLTENDVRYALYYFGLELGLAARQSARPPRIDDEWDMDNLPF